MGLIINNQMIQGTPFLIKEGSVSRKGFLNSSIRAYFLPVEHSEGTGNSVSFSIINAMKASLGELIERSSMYKSFYRGGIEYPCFSLIDGSESKVEANYIFLNHKLPALKEGNLSFSDSCGVASHKTSNDSINAAFLEFVERQSFIHSWISQSKGKMLDIKEIKENMPSLLEKFNLIENYISEIYFFDISIHREVKVVLMLGFGKTSFSIGLNADWYYGDAINGAVNEFLESLDVNFYINDISDDLELYKKNYMSIKPEEFKEAYQYLLTTSSKENIDWNYTKENHKLKTKIRQISKDLKFTPYMCFIPSNQTTGIKIVKVFSPDCYPHMNTMILEPETYKISNTLGVQYFPNKYKALPFP